MDKLAQASRALKRLSVAHSVYHDCVHVDLPGEFGTLELKVWPNGEDSIQLLDGDFHTHSNVLVLDLGTAEDEAFTTLVSRMISNDILLIEETGPDGEVRRTIQESIDRYLKYLPDSWQYRIVNGA